MSGRTGPVVVALASGTFTIGVAEFIVTGLLGDIATEFSVPQSAVGTAISAYALGAVAGAPLLTIAGARLSRRTLLLVAMSLVVLGGLGGLLAPTLPVFVAARFVAGLPHGAFFAAAASVGVLVAEPHRRGRITSRIVLGQTVAGIVGIPATAYLGQHYSWRTGFALVLVCGVVSLTAMAVVVPRLPAAAETGVATSVRALNNRQVWLTAVTAVAGFAGVYAVLSYIAPISVGFSGLAASAVPLVLMTFGIGMTLGAVVGGRLADWSPTRSIPLAFGTAAVVLLGFALTMRSPWTPFAAALGLGVVIQVALPALQLHLMNVAPDALAVVAAVNQSAINIANAIGTSAGAAMLAATSSHRALGFLGAAFAAGGLILALATLPWRGLDGGRTAGTSQLHAGKS